MGSLYTNMKPPKLNGLALPQKAKGPLSSSGMPAMPGQSPLGMSVNAPPGNSLTASRGNRSPLS